MDPIEEIVTTFVSPHFPFLTMPRRVICPDQEQEDAMLAALELALRAKEYPLHVVDLRPSPADRLNALTEQLVRATDVGSEDLSRSPTFVRAVLGLDLLEGFDNEEPIYPFRSRFQFDRTSYWLFVGRDKERMRRLFKNRNLPLYEAAFDMTPAGWKT